VKEAYMRNRTLFAGAIIAVAAAVIAAVTAGPAIGPQASRADRQPATISTHDLHRQVDASKLPIEWVAEPY
jgi:hypothetical protein